MLFLRSLLFNALFFGLTAIVGLLAAPLLLLPRRAVRHLMHLWGRALLGLLPVCGIRIVVSGQENLPRSGPALIASKHQSAFDTFVWFALLPDVAFVMKKELFRIPVYGWFARRGQHLGVDRDAGGAALRQLIREAKVVAAQGRQIVIFPEGTRTAPGEPRPFQPGIVALAAATGLPVIPVATDSGERWPRRAFIKRPGPLHIRIMPPMTGRQDLLSRLQDAIEEEQARLPRG